MDHLQQIISAWDQQHPKWVAPPEDILRLADAAKSAKDAASWLWADTRLAMEEHSGLTKREAADMVRSWRIAADLGRSPEGYMDFIAAFVAARGLRFKVDGTFVNASKHTLSNADVRNQIAVWAGDHGAFASAAALNGAWAEWRRLAHKEALHACYDQVKFDPTADTTIFDRILDLILHPEADTLAHRQTAKAVLQNFVHRVKNAMRGTVLARTHIMPYLMGVQGSGKTTSVEHLFSPIEEAATATSFDMLEDQSRMMDLTTMPVIFFDEMANARRSEVNKVKGLMTSRSQQFRQLYQEAGKREIISTFIGCGNFDLDTLIMDPSGNRRFFQINVRDRIDLAAIRALDAMAFWRSVNEDAEAPAFQNDIYALIRGEQAEQRYKTPVERWLDSDHDIPVGRWATCELLFTDHFEPWRDRFFPIERYHLGRFGKELKLCCDQRLEHRSRSGRSEYRLMAPDASAKSNERPRAFPKVHAIQDIWDGKLAA
ncbi:VapE domain-containing protein [Azospirillum sp.]|uniref:VapE domain-containing protein n=1 Tax=Azospirillum sp. TaxID=34012 RepID=UPI002612CFAF|nr:VapE domain-containing protein [Azospirillum sp.]